MEIVSATIGRRILNFFASGCGNVFRFLSVGLAYLVVTAASSSPAQADPRCRSGVSVTYELSNTMLEHAAAKASSKLTSQLRTYIPSAQPVDLNRLEHQLRLNYDLGLRRYLTVRFYAGLAVSPEDTVYRTSGDASYHDLALGRVDVVGFSGGSLYTTGTEFLFQTGDCREVLHLIGGLGAGFTGFEGDMRGEFDTKLTGDGTDLTLRGSYAGFAFDLHAVAGVRFDIARHAYIMLFGGYRGGIGYIKLKSDIKNGDGALPVYGPIFQANLGYSF